MRSGSRTSLGAAPPRRMELHLIRHPRPAVAPGICYGRLDVGLAESAAEAAARLRPLLPGTFALHASPLARASRASSSVRAAGMGSAVMGGAKLANKDWYASRGLTMGSIVRPPGPDDNRPRLPPLPPL